MHDPALAHYLRTCYRRLHQQQTALIDHFGLRSCAAIEVQPATGLMKLDVPGRGQAIATVTPIARYCPASLAWRWAWTAPSAWPLPTHSKIALQSLASKTGLSLFTTAQLTLELEQVSLLVAMACSRLKASGCYRWLDGDESVLLAINHLAFTTAELESSQTGDRLQLSQVRGARVAGQSQDHQLLRLSPSRNTASTALTWPSHRTVEGLFIHTLCQGQLENLDRSLPALKSLGCGDSDRDALMKA